MNVQANGQQGRPESRPQDRRESRQETWARLTGAARDLAATFERRGGDDDSVKQNIADLTAAGIIAADGPDGYVATPAENMELLRIVAGGCGPTAFAMAAALAEGQPRDVREQWGHVAEAAALAGLAERAYGLAVRRAKAQGAPTRLPGTQFAVARMRGELATMSALLTPYAGKLAEISDMAVSVADTSVPRYYIGLAAERVVSAALEVAGAAAGSAGPVADGDADAIRLRRIWSDLKAGPTLPFSADLALERIGKATLGVDLDVSPRWL